MLEDDGFLYEVGLSLMMTNNSRKGACPPRNVKSNQAMAEVCTCKIQMKFSLGSAL